MQKTQHILHHFLRSMATKPNCEIRGAEPTSAGVERACGLASLCSYVMSWSTKRSHGQVASSVS